MDTILGLVRLYHATLEALEVPVRCTADPTDTPPEFALSAVDATAPGSWSEGSWIDGAGWTDKTKTARAMTPLIGGAGELEITSGTDYALWVRITAGTEEPAWVCGTITCP